MNNLKTKKLLLVLGTTLLLMAIAAASAYYFIALKAPTSNTQSNTNKTCTTANNRLPEQCIEDYIGLTKEGAIERAKKYGYDPFPVLVDGVRQIREAPGGPSTPRTPPIYMIINHGIVTDAYFESSGK